MLLKKTICLTSIFLLNVFQYSYGQNIIIKYVGNSDNSINLTYKYTELGNSFTTLNRNNRILSIKSNDPQGFKCNDISRYTFIYAEPNETIDLNLNEKGLIVYSCSKSPYRKLESQFINDCYEKYGPTEAIFIKKIRDLQKIKKKIQSAYFDENYKGENLLLEKYYAEKKISKQFYKHFKSILWSLSQMNRLNNPREQNAGFADLEKSFPTAKNLMNVCEYRRCLLMYSYLKMKHSKIKIDLYNSLQFISTHFSNRIIIDYLSYYQLNFYLLNSKRKVDKKSLNLFYTLCNNKQFSDEIKTDFNQSIHSVFLKKLIEKSGYKLILIDFWASWCKPCLEEIPYSKKRIKEYPQVKYLFISIDKSKSAWLNETQKRTELFNSSNSYLINEIEDMELLNKLKITTIPRFVLLNQKGEIINSNFPRPSDPNFKLFIDEILDKQ